MYFIPIKYFFSQKNPHNKKFKFVTARSSNFSATAEFSPMLVETPYSGGVIQKPT